MKAERISTQGEERPAAGADSRPPGRIPNRTGSRYPARAAVSSGPVGQTGDREVIAPVTESFAAPAPILFEGGRLLCGWRQPDDLGEDRPVEIRKTPCGKRSDTP